VKLFLDQGVPRRAASILREADVSAVHASEIGLSSADDSDILSWCLSNQAIAVTLDADLHARIALRRNRALAPFLVERGAVVAAQGAKRLEAALVTGQLLPAGVEILLLGRVQPNGCCLGGENVPK
jgi:hypothetical protein